MRRRYLAVLALVVCAAAGLAAAVQVARPTPPCWSSSPKKVCPTTSTTTTTDSTQTHPTTTASTSTSTSTTVPTTTSTTTTTSSTSTTTTTTTTTAPPPSTAGAGIGAWRISGNDTLLGEGVLQLGRYSVVVMNDWQAAPGSSQFLSPAQIHADNPATKVLMYASGPGVDSSSTTLQAEQYETNTGVTMYDVNNGHPEWLLRDSAGNPIRYAGYPTIYVGDFGLASFRQKWVANVVARAQSLGFDGVSLDDIVSSFNGLTGGILPAKYPTQAAWDSALLGFIQYVAPALKAQGLYVGAEVFGWNDAGGSQDNDGTADAAWWAQVAPSLNAIFCEYFEQNPNNFGQSFDSARLDWTGNWDGWLRLVDVAQNAGADFWGLDYSTGTASTDLRLMTYGKASFLLKWNGKPLGAFFWQNGRNATSGSNPWDPNWTLDIGAPAGAMYPVGSGAYRRDYSAGTVIVNPTLSTQTFSLGGTYRTPSGATVTSVTLAPTSAAILSR